MSAEAEAGEILVRIMGQGMSEMIRLSGQGAMLAGRGAVSLMTFCYAIKAGGSPAEIARNPGGMAIITIPEEHLEEFRKAAKAYKLNFFSVNSKKYDAGYLDLCMKSEDVAPCQRILEMMGIVAVRATGATTLDQQGIAVRGSQTFEEASAKLQQYAQGSEECFNRQTDRDFSRDEPYVVCDRLNPNNFVIVHPRKDMFEGEEYTRSTYVTYQGGIQTGEFDDGRFAGRGKDYWTKTRKEIVENASLPENDIVYFKTLDDHKAYQALAEGRTVEPVAEVNVEGNLSEIAEAIKENLQAVGISQKVPENAQKTIPPTVESVNGQETGKLEAKNTTTTKTTDVQMSFGEKAEIMKQKSQTFDASLNRRTNKDFSRDEPYAVCDRMNPMSYIILSPKQAVYDDQAYTKTTYRIYRNGEAVGTFDDGRSANRDKYYWGQLKDQMQSAGGFENDMIYFRDLDSLKAYQNLYGNAQATPEIAEGIGQLADKAINGVDPVTDKTPVKENEHQTEVNGKGGSGKTPIKEKTSSAEGGVKEFAEKYKANHPAADAELSKAIKEKMSEMRMKQ